MDAGISGSQEAAEQRGCRCYQVNVSRVVGGSTDVENFKLGRRRTGRSEKRKEERVEEARDVERGEREERGKKEKKREREREREPLVRRQWSMVARGCPVVTVGINTGCSRHLRR